MVLANSLLEYKHSSAMYYETDKQAEVQIIKYIEMLDVDFSSN
jgi:hypothetical protein